MRTFFREKTLKDYLLGSLDSKQAREIELCLMTDAEFLETMSTIEDEIIYDYLTGDLSAREAEQFEKYFLITPERRRRLKFLRVLKKKVGKSTDLTANSALQRSWKHLPPGFLPQFSMSKTISVLIALLILISGGTWLLLRSRYSQSESTKNAQPTVLVATLLPDQMRGPTEVGMTRVEIHTGIDIVRLRLQLGVDLFQVYRAELLNDRSIEQLNWEGLRAEGQVVSLDIPSNSLPVGDYQIVLSGHKPDGTYENTGRYYFRVLKK